MVFQMKSAMVSMQPEHLKAQKAKAVTRHHWQRSLKHALNLFHISAALFLFYPSSLIPITLEFCSRFYSQSIALFSNSVCVFIIANAIIVFLNVRKLQDHNKTDAGDAFYDEYVCLRNNNTDPSSLAESESPLVFISNGTMKEQIVFKDGAPQERKTHSVSVSEMSRKVAAPSRVANVKVTEIKDTTETICCRMGLNGENPSAMKKSFEKLPSENYDRRFVVKPGVGELQRTEIQNRSKLKCYRRGDFQKKSVCCVERMSNEEFNRTVEDFIVKQKRKLLEEENRTQCLALNEAKYSKCSAVRHQRATQ